MSNENISDEAVENAVENAAAAQAAAPRPRIDFEALADPTRVRAEPPSPSRDVLAAPADASITLAIGPEGGFAARDLQVLDEAGFHGLRLGPRILRTETAGLAAIAALYRYALDEGALERNPAERVHRARVDGPGIDGPRVHRTRGHTGDSGVHRTRAASPVSDTMGLPASAHAPMPPSTFTGS